VRGEFPNEDAVALKLVALWQNLSQLLLVPLHELVDSRRTYLETYGLEDIKLLLLDLRDFELVMSNLVDHCPHQEGDHVLVLGRDEHRHDARDVQVTAGEVLLRELEVAVEDIDCEEEGLVGALKGSEHFYHPVDHLGPVVLAYAVLAQELIEVDVAFDLLQVDMDVGAVVIKQVQLEGSLLADDGEGPLVLEAAVYLGGGHDLGSKSVYSPGLALIDPSGHGVPSQHGLGGLNVR
jgi:hypothetical protein